jgi:hypothetical protein
MDQGADRSLKRQARSILIELQGIVGWPLAGWQIS